MHGEGHGADHLIPKEFKKDRYHTLGGILDDGKGLKTYYRNTGTHNVTSPEANEPYINAIMSKYGTNRASDNYCDD